MKKKLKASCHSGMPPCLQTSSTAGNKPILVFSGRYRQTLWIPRDLEQDPLVSPWNYVTWWEDNTDKYRQYPPGPNNNSSEALLHPHTQTSFKLHISNNMQITSIVTKKVRFMRTRCAFLGFTSSEISNDLCILCIPILFQPISTQCSPW